MTSQSTQPTNSPAAAEAAAPVTEDELEALLAAAVAADPQTLLDHVATLTQNEPIMRVLGQLCMALRMAVETGVLQADVLAAHGLDLATELGPAPESQDA